MLCQFYSPDMLYEGDVPEMLSEHDHKDMLREGYIVALRAHNSKEVLQQYTVDDIFKRCSENAFAKECFVNGSRGKAL